MPAQAFVTFAYGSNMPTGRLRQRCPSAAPLGVAELPGYELRWHKKSRDGSGKCDIVKSNHADARVFGVLCRIASAEKTLLDRAEGLGAGYAEIEVQVRFNGANVTAKAYQATATDPSLKPYSWYKAFVLAGAGEHGLPAEYCAQLAAVEAIDDPDRERHETNMRMIEGVPA